MSPASVWVNFDHRACPPGSRAMKILHKTPSGASRRHRRSCGGIRRIVLWLAALSATTVFLAGLAVASVIRLDGDAARLRHALLGSRPAWSDTRVQLSLGGMALSLARGIVALTPAEEEARLALRAVRAVSVGVYEVAGEMGAGEGAMPDIVARADAAMGRRGWSRVVTVQDGNERVLVFVDEESLGGSRPRICIGVIEGGQLVVVTATLAAEPLGELLEAGFGKMPPL